MENRIIENKWIKLLEYIIENSEVESPFLTPIPSTTIEIFGLLDKIAELRNISKKKNGIEYNKLIDKQNEKKIKTNRTYCW